MKSSLHTATKSKVPAVDHRSSGGSHMPAPVRVKTAVADSTSTVSVRSSSAVGKRKSPEKEWKDRKKGRPERSFYDSPIKKDKPKVTPLTNIVIPKRKGMMCVTFYVSVYLLCLT